MHTYVCLFTYMHTQAQHTHTETSSFFYIYFFFYRMPNSKYWLGKENSIHWEMHTKMTPRNSQARADVYRLQPQNSTPGAGTHLMSKKIGSDSSEVTQLDKKIPSLCWNPATESFTSTNSSVQVLCSFFLIFCYIESSASPFHPPPTLVSGINADNPVSQVYFQCCLFNLGFNN